MAQATHEGAPVESIEPIMSRRSFLKKAGTVGLVAAGTFGAFRGVESITSKHEETKNSSSDGPEKSSNLDFTVTSAQAAENIRILTQSPDLYSDRPWADPHQLIGLSNEELQDIAAVPITDETRTDEGFGKVFAEKLELLFNAGLTVEDAEIARDTYRQPVGERNAVGKDLGAYEEYVKQEYGVPMSEGLFMRIYAGRDCSEAIDDGIGETQDYVARKFEHGLNVSLTGEAATADTTSYTNLESVEALPSIDGDRRLLVNMTFRSPNRGMEDLVKNIEITARLNSELHDGKYGVYMESFSRAKV